MREVRETEPNDRTPDPAVLYPLPVVINGQILPGGVDRFAFTARKGHAAGGRGRRPRI